MALTFLFTVELRSQSESISHNFSAAISIAERISVKSFVCTSLVPRSSHLHQPSVIQSTVGPSHKAFYWTVTGSDFLNLE